MKKSSFYSEFRQDPVSGDWILIAPGRGRRPSYLNKKKTKRSVPPKKTCPFEDPSSQRGLSLCYRKEGKKFVRIDLKKEDSKLKDWKIVVFENKYPAVKPLDNLKTSKHYKKLIAVPGVGYHDLVVTRGHDENFADLSESTALKLFEVFKERYLSFLNDSRIAYVSIFHNWGPRAGASIFHPHYQIISIPVVPPDVKHSVSGSESYYRKNKECVHCSMVKWERNQKKRIIFESDRAIAFAPFVSRAPFEVRVFPKVHESRFEESSQETFAEVCFALQKSLKLIRKNLGDPDYNFFIHTAPVKNRESFSHYHWHIEIFPRLNIRAGFEFSTGIEINTVDPDAAASILRK